MSRCTVGASAVPASSRLISKSCIKTWENMGETAANHGLTMLQPWFTGCYGGKTKVIGKTDGVAMV